MPTYPELYNVGFRDTASLDAFSRLRVSNPEMLFDYQSEYDAGALLWEDDTTGSATATHDANEACVDLAVTTASGDKVIRQTRQYHRYQPGKSQLVLMTFVMATAASNLRQRAGYFDANNGIFLEVENTTVNLVRRTYTSGSAVDNETAQASWNIDPFDGTGPSGVTLDLTKCQILVIDMEWLGVGRVRAGFVVDGKIYYAHEWLNANSLTLVYMTTANLPLRYEIEATGTLGGAATLKAICGSVMSEGGFEISRGIPGSANRGSTVLSITTEVAVISIRPKSTFNSIVNRGQIIVQKVASYADTTGALFKLIYNPTLGGSPSWTSAGSNSIVEYDTAGTTITGGDLIDSWYVPASALGQNSTPGAATLGLLSRLPLALDIAGTADTQTHLTLSATRIGGSGTCNVLGAMTWQELR